MTDFVSIAAGAISILSPYLPQLLSIGKDVGSGIKDAVIDKGVDALGSQAKKLWEKIWGSFKSDPVLTSAATMVADSPEDAGRRKMLAEVLAQRLENNPELARELLEIIGGPTRLQQVIAGNEATIRDIRQKMKGSGEQTIRSGDKAIIERVEQDMGD